MGVASSYSSRLRAGRAEQAHFFRSQKSLVLQPLAAASRASLAWVSLQPCPARCSGGGIARDLGGGSDGDGDGDGDGELRGGSPLGGGLLGERAAGGGVGAVRGGGARVRALSGGLLSGQPKPVSSQSSASAGAALESSSAIRHGSQMDDLDAILSRDAIP